MCTALHCDVQSDGLQSSSHSGRGRLVAVQVTLPLKRTGIIICCLCDGQRIPGWPAKSPPPPFIHGAFFSGENSYNIKKTGFTEVEGEALALVSNWSKFTGDLFTDLFLPHTFDIYLLFN